MARRRIKMTLMVMVLSMTSLFAFAQQVNYEVLFSNSDKIRIGKEAARVGLKFSDNNEIYMPSVDCALEVRNLRDGTNELVIGEKYIKNGVKTLGEYLIEERHLSTKSFRDDNPPYEFDTVWYILDTIRVVAPDNHLRKTTIKAIAHIGMDSIVSVIPRSRKGTEYLVPRNVLGKHDDAPFYLDIIEKDIEKEWEYYVWRKLYVKPLPLKVQ